MAKSDVDAAIAAAAAQPAPAPRWQGRVTLASGKEVGMDVPMDLTPGEVLAVVAFASTEIPKIIKAAQAQQPRSRLLLPTQ